MAARPTSCWNRNIASGRTLGRIIGKRTIIVIEDIRSTAYGSVDPGNAGIHHGTRTTLKSRERGPDTVHQDGSLVALNFGDPILHVGILDGAHHGCDGQGHTLLRCDSSKPIVGSSVFLDRAEVRDVLPQVFKVSRTLPRMVRVPRPMSSGFRTTE